MAEKGDIFSSSLRIVILLWLAWIDNPFTKCQVFNLIGYLINFESIPSLWRNKTPLSLGDFFTNPNVVISITKHPNQASLELWEITSSFFPISKPISHRNIPCLILWLARSLWVHNLNFYYQYRYVSLGKLLAICCSVFLCLTFHGWRGSQLWNFPPLTHLH